MGMKLLKTHLSRPLNDWSFPLTGFISVLFLGLSIFYWQHPQELSWLIGARDAIFSHHEVWRLFSTIAIHADLRHFLANSVFFVIFGVLLHSYYGIWVFPVLSLVMGGVANALTLWFYPDHSVLVGASGVVYFMAGLWATMFFFIERRGRALKRAGMVICVITMLFFPTEFQPKVSYLAHFWGFVLGIPTGILYFYFNRERLRAAEVWRPAEPDEDLQWPAPTDPVPVALDNAPHS
jgi:rhomboid protease GluP